MAAMACCYMLLHAMTIAGKMLYVAKLRSAHYLCLPGIRKLEVARINLQQGKSLIDIDYIYIYDYIIKHDLGS